MFELTEHNTIRFEFDQNVYSLDSVLKCVYWLQEQWNHSIKQDKGKIYVTLHHKTPIESQAVFVSLADEVAKSFLDFNLKDRLFDKTNNIRELILAKAFSNYQGG